MSIVRIGLGETKHFAEGYDAIFGRKKRTATKRAKPKVKAAKTKAKKRKSN